MNELNASFLAVAEYFAILSDASRLKIIHAICQQPKSVNEVVEAVGLSQANVSRHLSHLYKAHVVNRRKEGSAVFYTVNDPVLMDLCGIACNRIAANIEEAQPLKQQLLDLMLNSKK